jgi:2-phosphosulfolactate phosphatase
MTIDVVLLPRELRPEHLAGKTVVVFDVLRATTTMTAALVAGVKEIQVFGTLDAALEAGRAFRGPHFVCGERNAVKPPGFDLGNSPGVFNPEIHRNATLLMTTTNGTVAILAAKGAAAVFIGALVNADAVAQVLGKAGRDLTLLCAGTEGYVSSEDVLGAGAVIDALESRTRVQLISDNAWMARSLFRAERMRLKEALSESRGGHNIQRAGLTPDIAFCANLNSIDVVGVVQGDLPVVRRFDGDS